MVPSGEPHEKPPKSADVVAWALKERDRYLKRGDFLTNHALLEWLKDKSPSYLKVATPLIEALPDADTKDFWKPRK